MQPHGPPPLRLAGPGRTRPRALHAATLSLLALAASLGCGPSEGSYDRVRRYAELPGALASTEPGLVEELAAVRLERGLPMDLTPSLPPDDGDAARALARAMGDSQRFRLEPLTEELVRAETLRDAAPADPVVHAQRIRELLVSTRDLTPVLAAAADMPRCAFDVDPALGFFAKLRFLDDTAIAARLHLLSATDAGQREAPDEACDNLVRALRWSEWLARERLVECRVLGATLRGEALALVGRLLERGELGPAEAQRLYTELRETLLRWPSERRMLFGDRAVTMHAYEALRDGMFGKVVTLDERRRLERRGELDRFEKPDPRDLDRDEANYLRAMRRVIESCEEGAPLVERIGAIERSVQDARESPDLFAGRLFLADLPDALRVAARDRARCEAWAIALAAGADLPPPPFRASPVTGTPYAVARDAQWARVALADPLTEDPTCPVWIDHVSGGSDE